MGVDACCDPESEFYEPDKTPCVVKRVHERSDSWCPRPMTTCSYIGIIVRHSGASWTGAIRAQLLLRAQDCTSWTPRTSCLFIYAHFTYPGLCLLMLIIEHSQSKSNNTNTEFIQVIHNLLVSSSFSI